MIHRTARTPRRGIMLVAVLVCLVVVTLLGAASCGWRSRSVPVIATMNGGCKPNGWSNRASSALAAGSPPIEDTPARSGRSEPLTWGSRRRASRLVKPRKSIAREQWSPSRSIALPASRRPCEGPHPGRLSARRAPPGAAFTGTIHRSRTTEDWSDAMTPETSFPQMPSERASPPERPATRRASP